MLRKLYVLTALASVCAFGGSASAQTAAETAATSTGSGTKAELASYSQEYAASSVGGGAYPQAPQAMAYGRIWGGDASNRDCSRFYHYPYVYYPQNFRGSEYYRSSNSMYNRYPPEMQIPVYNRHWHNYYPSSRRYHWGHHFILDVF